MTRNRWVLTAAAVAFVLAGPAAAQTANAPQPTAMPPAIAQPRDVDYAGPIVLEIDASDVRRGIFSIHETIPVAEAGPFTLLYPQWIPGNHAPRGQIEKLASLVITGNGQTIPWRRDPVNVYAFHIDVPAGVRALDVRFQYLSPTSSDQGRVVATSEMLNLQWFSMVLYPSGYFARRIPVQASVTLPEGWRGATALAAESTSGATTRYEQVSLETLVDSPMFAGRHFRSIDLNPGGDAPVRLNLVGDRAEQIAATDEQIAVHRRLVRQALILFGGHHFNRYEFLLAMSDSMGGIGVEHQRSSENATGAGYFSEWDDYLGDHDLLPHEMSHSWNGKYRRPADLWTPNYEAPMRDSLLWVYEGQTQYWGYVLSARAGFWTKQQALDEFARTAATYEQRVGRAWRPLADTTNDPIIARRMPQAWRSWQRSEDYYSEGLLIWLDADTLIRERTNGARSLDTFARNFFGGVSDGTTQRTYTFDDVVAELNRVMPYDWASFLRERVTDIAPHAPLDGLARGGYRLVYTAERGEMQRNAEKRGERADFVYSLGIGVANTGRIAEVVWDGPMFREGVTVGTTIVAVNGIAYSADTMRRAITAAKNDTRPIEILVKNGDRYRTVSIDYHGGLRYPRLERIPGAPDRLGAIFRAR